LLTPATSTAAAGKWLLALGSGLASLVILILSAAAAL
jgi:hypothetical protein